MCDIMKVDITEFNKVYPHYIGRKDYIPCTSIQNDLLQGDEQTITHWSQQNDL